MNKFDKEFRKLLFWFFIMQLPYISVGILFNNILLVVITAIISSIIYFNYIIPKIYKETEEGGN